MPEIKKPITGKNMITDKLTTYKNKGQIGPMSSLMWGQASMLTESDIKLIGQFIEEGLPK